MRVLRHKGGYLLQHRYLSDEEVAGVQKDILLEREEEKKKSKKNWRIL